MQRIFTEAASGRTLRSITTGLIADGIPTPTGRGVWRATTISAILKDIRYSGEGYAYTYARTKDRTGAHVRVRPVEDRIALPEGVWPALVSADTFAAVQAGLQARQEQAARNNRAPQEALLRAGFVRCGLCGRPMTAKNSGQPYPMYRCQRDEPGEPRSVALSIKALDAATWAHVENVLTNPDVIAAEVAKLQAADPTEADLTAIDRRINQFAKKQTQLTKTLGLFTDLEAAEPVVRDLEALRQQQRELQRERQAILDRRLEWEQAQQRLNDLKAWCEQVAQRLPRATYEQRRTALTALGVTVTVYPKGHDPRYTIETAIKTSDIVSSTAACSTRAFGLR